MSDREQMVDLLKAILIRLDEIKDLLAEPNIRRVRSTLTADDIYAMTQRRGRQ